jgi:hypothetical protein
MQLLLSLLLTRAFRLLSCSHMVHDFQNTVIAMTRNIVASSERVNWTIVTEQSRVLIAARPRLNNIGAP